MRPLCLKVKVRGQRYPDGDLGRSFTGRDYWRDLMRIDSR